MQGILGFDNLNLNLTNGYIFLTNGCLFFPLIFETIYLPFSVTPLRMEDYFLLISIT